MILYHGSLVVVDEPKIIVPQTHLDFGIGFYTTTSHEQASNWAKIKMRRNGSTLAYVSCYEFDFDNAKKDNEIKKFENPSMEWLSFVMHNRKGNYSANNVDMHIGPVADDNIYQTIRFYESGIFDAEDTIKRLKTEILHDQWVFHSDKILKHIKFIKYEEIK